MTINFSQNTPGIEKGHNTLEMVIPKNMEYGELLSMIIHYKCNEAYLYAQ